MTKIAAKAGPNDLSNTPSQTQTQTLKQKSPLKFLSDRSNSKFERVSLNFSLKFCWRWRGACSTPRVSGIDSAYGISTEHMLLSNCVLQVMRVWSLPAVLSLLAKHDTPQRGNASWFRADPCGLNPAHAFPGFRRPSGGPCDLCVARQGVICCTRASVRTRVHDTARSHELMTRSFCAAASVISMRGSSNN